MKLDKIANTIIQEAETEKKIIISSANVQTKSIIENKKFELEGINLEKLTQFEQNIEKMVVENVTSKRLTAKREVQFAKDQVINKTLSKVKEKLYLIREDEKKYSSLIKNLYDEVIKEINEGDFEILCSKEDENLIKKIIKKVDVKISKDVKAGFIVKSKSKKMIIDFTFETLLRDKESEIKEVISKNVF